jgi:hypothetical protein
MEVQRISAHEGPLAEADKSYNGSAYNVLVEWETGECTYEPLHIVAADDPVTCAIYAKENGLLDLPGMETLQENCEASTETHPSHKPGQA